MSWETVTFEGLTFRVPVGLKRVGAQGIDTALGVWEGEGLVVRLEVGPFVDPLTSRSTDPDAETSEEEIDGRAARIVSQRPTPETIFVGAHFPNVSPSGERRVPMTMVIEGDSGQALVASEIAKSVKFG